MSRVQQKPAQRGSQKWIQFMVSQRQDVLGHALQQAGLLDAQENVTWLSPLASDEYAEYRDQDFLDRLGVSLPKRSLSSFWPRGGPQWDGLGKTSSGKLVLVEAKAHIREICSPPSQARAASLQLIQSSLNEVKDGLGICNEVDWAGTFYQYANRLAHLYLLRELNDLPAYLVFLNFFNDTDMSGPIHAEEWHGAITLLENYLGIPRRHKLSNNVIHISLDVLKSRSLP